MNVADLIRELEGDGIRLWQETGSLRYRAPKGALTDERRNDLRERKEAVIEYLRTRAEPMEIRPHPEALHEPFPVTDIQAAYLLGRRDSFAFGGVGCHGYGELIFPHLDPQRATAAWQTLIHRHEMLRAVVYEDGTQQILSDLPDYEISVLDLRTISDEEAAAEVGKIREKMSHRVYEPQQWPLFDLRITLQPHQAILHFSIDLLIADFVSTQRLLSELHQLLLEPDRELPAVNLSFRDYVLATQARRDEHYFRDREYWLGRLDALPLAPELPLLHRRVDGSARFRRWQLTLDPEDLAALFANIRGLGITLSTAVLAIFSEVISRWSVRPQFTLNVTLQHRQPLHPHVDRVVGDFTALELLAVEANPTQTFRDRARALQAQLWEDLDHQSFHGSEVMRELSRKREQTCLFPVVFTSSIGVAVASDGSPRGLGDLSYGITQTPQVWIDCQAIESERGLIVNWDTRAEIFPPGLIDDMFSAFQTLLESVSRSTEVWNEQELVKLSRAQLERRQAVNDTAGPLSETLLHEGFVSQALRFPARPAVITSTGSISFGELLGRALRVADLLRENGAVPGQLVAVVLEKGIDQPVAILGILLAGCAYVPLDNDQPPVRRNQILNDSGVALMLVHGSRVSDTDWPLGVTPLSISGLTPAPVPELMPDRFQSPNQPAYVIYTSGSTGAAKGVIVSHLSAVNTINDINHRFGVGPSDRVLSLSNLGFDLSVYDFFGVLGAGGSVVLPDDCRRADPSHWAELILAHQVTLWNSVPALMQMLHDYLIGEGDGQPALSSMRLALLSGDWIPVMLPNQIRKLLPGLSVVSLGGATEAAIWSIFHPIETVSPGWTSIPYGKPLTNQNFYVLNQSLSACPDWVPGELYIGGVGLALGYWGDETKTAERFIQHRESGERLYRTGDWGRYHPDGKIEFLGREDRQVKIRGHRVEIGEVEVALGTHPMVERAAVVVSNYQTWDRRLIAFVEPVAQRSADSSSAEIPASAELVLDTTEDQIAGVHYPEYRKRLDQAALLSMLFALQEWGLFRSTAPELDHFLTSFSPQHRRLIRRWLRALRENGFLVYQPESNRYAGAREVNPILLEDAWESVAEAAKGLEDAAVTGFFRDAGLRLPEFLKSGGDVSQIISSEDLCGFLRAVHTNTSPSRWAKRALSVLLRQLASTRKAGLHVLELGAAAPLSVGYSVGAHGIDTLITDRSSRLLEEAGQQLNDGEGVRFAVFDPDFPYRSQGLQPNSFDVVVARNTLHQSRNIDVAIKQISELLSSSGWLIFAEATEDHYPIMVSLELLLNPDTVTGDFLDHRKGRDQTLLTAAEWREAILRAGGELVDLPESEMARQSGVQVFAARFKTNRARIESSDLLAYLTTQLPPYMVPSRIQVVDAIPLTANAKTDYQLLRTWISSNAHQHSPVTDADRTDLENRLTELWEEVLNVTDIRRTQDFLSLGGDSLIAARLAARLRERIPEAVDFFFDELLQEILKGASIASLGSTLSGTADKKRIATPAHPEKNVAVAIRKLGGSGEPVRVVLPENIDDLSAVKRLADLLSKDGTVVGVELEDRDAYLSLSTDSLIEAVAGTCVDALIDEAYLSFDIIGFGAGAGLALAIARQMTEAGGIVGDCFVIGGFLQRNGGTALSEQSTGNPISLHSRVAITNWDAAPYAGDITILGNPEDSNRESEIADFWSGLCLGDLGFLQVADDDFDGIVKAVTGDNARGQRTA